MVTTVRRHKLHIRVGCGDHAGPAHLMAASDFQLRSGSDDRVTLAFDLEPSLRTPRRQQAMYCHAHALAQAPDMLRMVEMPGLVEELSDARLGAGLEANWQLEIRMPGYGVASYSVRAELDGATVRFIVHTPVTE